jgi:hypothetical protein
MSIGGMHADLARVESLFTEGGAHTFRLKFRTHWRLFQNASTSCTRNLFLLLRGASVQYLLIQ